MSSRFKILCATAAVAAVAAWMSYRTGYSTGKTKSTGANLHEARERRTRPLEERKDGMERLRGLLSRPANGRTSAEAWKIISGFSIQQLQAALAVPDSDKPSEAAMLQKSMLFFRWGQLDPLQAMEGADLAGKDVYGGQPATAVLTAWMKRDPDAAFQWAMQSPLTGPNLPSVMMARLLSSLPLDQALEKAKSYDPKVRVNLLTQFGAVMGTTPADREKLVTALANSGCDQKETSAVMSRLMISWGAADPAAALAALGDSSIDKEIQDRTRNQLINYWTERDLGAVIAWMAKGANPLPLRDQVNAYQKVADRDPEGAANQLESLSRESPGLREEVMKSLITNYDQGGGIPFGSTERSEALVLSRLKIHYDSWAHSDPQGAASWMKTLEPELQQKLATSSPHETH